MLLEKSITSFTGAVITGEERGVRKHCINAKMQGLYCEELGTKVCPEVFEINSGDYLMERLRFCADSVTATQVKEHAEATLWNRDCPYVTWYWRTPLEKWLGEHGTIGRWLTMDLDDLYRGGPPSRWISIHGDLTASNVMYRMVGLDDPGLGLVFIDPLQPHGKIPPFKEVDLGKMLQSAIGWEAVAHGYESKFTIDEILAGESYETKQRAFFWLRVHLLRIIPYTQRSDIHEWVKEKVCSTFLT